MNREEKIAESLSRKAGFGKYKTLTEISNGLVEMLNSARDILEKEKEAVSSGEARFDYSVYYRYAVDALENCHARVYQASKKE